MEEQELKRVVEAAIGYGPDSLLPTSWKAVYKSVGRHYLAWAAGKPSGLYNDIEEAWQDLVDKAREQYEHQQGLLQDFTEPEPPPSTKLKPEEESDHPAVKHLSERTKARAEALSELYAFRTGEDTPTNAMRVKLRPGGLPVDDDIRQVIHMEVQAWVSPEEVRDVFRSVRNGLLEEGERIQKKPSTLRIATFVWRQWRQALEEGRDLPGWAILRKLWLQNYPSDKRVRGHGDFQRYFNRAAKAIIPRYRERLFPDLEARAREARIIKKLEALAKEIGGDTPFSENPFTVAWDSPDDYREKD